MMRVKRRAYRRKQRRRRQKAWEGAMRNLFRSFQQSLIENFHTDTPLYNAVMSGNLFREISGEDA